MNFFCRDFFIKTLDDSPTGIRMMMASYIVIYSVAIHRIFDEKKLGHAEYWIGLAGSSSSTCSVCFQWISDLKHALFSLFSKFRLNIESEKTVCVCHGWKLNKERSRSLKEFFMDAWGNYAKKVLLIVNLIFTVINIYSIICY